MKTPIKKAAILIAVLALALGTAAQVLAVDIGPSSGGKATSSDTTLNIVKTLKVTNPNLAKVAGPGLQLTYTLAPTNVAAGTVISDGDNNAAVHAGPVDGLTITTMPSFTVTDLLNASESGTDNAKNIVLTADLTKFTETGVYRYTLTDTTSSTALTQAGVDRSEHFNPVRYVDVYIQREGNDLVVEGYVVGSDLDVDGKLAKETFDTSTTDEDPQAVGYNTYDTRDVFETYNLQLTKSVTGSMGDIHNEFPFSIALTNNTRAFYSAEGTPPTTASTLNQNAGTDSLSTDLKHGDTYYIAGLRKNEEVAYTETNNTGDTYKVSITGGTASAASNVAPNGTKTMASTPAPQATNVTFENNHGSVSPTGVITRFAPYIGMVLIAALLFVVMRRTRARS